MLAGMLRACGACKKEKPIEDFDSYKKDPTKLLVQCRTCTSYKKKWDQSEGGKAFWHKRNTSDGAKKNKKKWANTDFGKAWNKEYHEEYEKTDKCKKRRQEWAKTENGKRNSRIQGQKLVQRLRENPDRRLAWNIRVRMYATLKGRLHQSATIIRNTEFPSLESLKAHFEEQLSGEMTISNYGAVWDIEHTIALIWYDHSDPEDVKRCWSKQNLRPMLARENSKKSYKIDDDTCRSVDPMFWPKAWNGRIPDREQKREMYKRVRRGEGA